MTALSSTESEFVAAAQAALGLLCECLKTCAPAGSDTPHGSHGYACKRVYEDMRARRGAYNALRTARKLRSRQVAACSASMGIIGVRAILEDLGFEQSGPTYLFTDSQGAYKSVQNPINSKLRHVNMRYHRIRQAIRDGHVCPHQIRTHEQLADIFTKPLSAPDFERLRPLCLGYGEKPALPDDLRAQLRGERPCIKPLRAKNATTESVTRGGPRALHTIDDAGARFSGFSKRSIQSAYM